MIFNGLPQIMARRKLSIRELSRLTGITYTTIRAVYHGERRSIQLEVLNAICQTLDVQPGDIYHYRPQGAQPPTISRTDSGKVNSLIIEKPDETVAAKVERHGDPIQTEGWKNW